MPLPSRLPSLQTKIEHKKVISTTKRDDDQTHLLSHLSRLACFLVTVTTTTSVVLETGKVSVEVAQMKAGFKASSLEVLK